MDERVRGVFDAYDPDMRDLLLSLRATIYDVAETTDGVGPLTETLKWGQISYLNPAGTTLRIDTAPDDDERVAMYVHCQTSIVETLRADYEGVLDFDGTRAIILPRDEAVPDEIVHHCIRRALTYRLWRRT